MKQPMRMFALVSVLAIMVGGEIALADDDGLKAKTVPFLLKLNVGDAVTIATNGDLEIFARCKAFDNFRLIEVVATSSNEFAGPANFFGELNSAGSEATLFAFGKDELAFFNGNGQGSVVQDGSHYIGIDGDSTALGVNIFGFDCFTAGTAVLIKKSVDDDDD